MASNVLLFEAAERIETLSGRIYGALAKVFGGDPDARALFVRLQAEEEQHASRVRLLAAHYRRDAKLAVDGEAAELEACSAAAAQALAEVEAGRWGADLDEVKRRLAALEEALARAHAHLLARSASPALREFFAVLAEQDEAHARLLGR